VSEVGRAQGGSMFKLRRCSRCTAAQALSPAVATPAGAAPGVATPGVGAQADLGAATGAGSRFPPGIGSKREKRNSVAKGAATR